MSPVVRPTAIEMARNPRLTDEEVVDRVRAGATELFEVLMRRHNQRVYRAARSIVRSESEAEEVTQQAYVDAFAHLDQFTGAAKFSTWLIRIAVNRALATARRADRVVLVDDDSEGYETMKASDQAGQGPEERASARELRGILEVAIDALPDGYREVFMLREVEGLSTADTAACLGLGEENVKVRLHRAKRTLRDRICKRIGASAVEAFRFGDERCDRVVAGVFERIRARARPAAM